MKWQTMGDVTEFIFHHTDYKLAFCDGKLVSVATSLGLNHWYERYEREEMYKVLNNCIDYIKNESLVKIIEQLKKGTRGYDYFMMEVIRRRNKLVSECEMLESILNKE